MDALGEIEIRIEGSAGSRKLSPNECIELAKEFGGTDGHKYVNAVLNGLAPSLRAEEVRAHRAIPAAP